MSKIINFYFKNYILELGSCLAMPSHAWQESLKTLLFPSSLWGFTWQPFSKFYFLGWRICSLIVLFLEHEIFKQNLKHLNLGTHNLFWTQVGRNKKRTWNKIMNKFKFPWKNEEEQASIFSSLKSELDSKKISIWFQFANEFGTRPWVRLQLPEAWTQCSFIVVFA